MGFKEFNEANWFTVLFFFTKCYLKLARGEITLPSAVYVKTNFSPSNSLLAFKNNVLKHFNNHMSNISLGIVVKIGKSTFCGQS